MTSRRWRCERGGRVAVVPGVGAVSGCDTRPRGCVRQRAAHRRSAGRGSRRRWRGVRWLRRELARTVGDVPTMYHAIGKQREQQGTTGTCKPAEQDKMASTRKNASIWLRAHNPKVVGSNPTPATNWKARNHGFPGLRRCRALLRVYRVDLPARLCVVRREQGVCGRVAGRRSTGGAIGQAVAMRSAKRAAASALMPGRRCW